MCEYNNHAIKCNFCQTLVDCEDISKIGWCLDCMEDSRIDGIVNREIVSEYGDI